MSLSFFKQFVNSFKSSEDSTLPVENVTVSQVPSDDNTLTLQAMVGLREVSLSVPVGSTYAEVLKLAKEQVPALQADDANIVILNTNTNTVVHLTCTVTAAPVSLETQVGTAG